ncbi:MAG: YkgJ family cysteine cluster protein [Candidatus Lokiarchaeota archaeon]|nr:YkgJ family cysteine cluster protein [Candidatus Lokiarchaeota archaeon]
MPPFKCNHDGTCTEIRLCCTDTEMTLTKKDAKRIDALGYNREDYLIRMDDGFCQIRNIEGRCYFYNPDQLTCRIYSHRPEGCKYYPIVYNVEKGKCVVDYDCPSGKTVTEEDIEEICDKVKFLVTVLMKEADCRDGPC